MRISINELLQDQTDERMYRVLWIDPDAIISYLIDITDHNAWPVLRRVREIIDEIITEELVKIKDDPFNAIMPDQISVANLEKRDQAWAAIKEIVTNEPDCYDKSKRNAMLSAAMQTHNITRPTIQKFLRRYWQRGKTPNALLPDYQNSGGRGKEKSASDRKRGRPSQYGLTGSNVDESTKRVFRLALEKYYLTTKKNSLKDAYRLMIKEFYTEDYYSEGGQKKLVLADEQSIPTLRQFRYWFKKEYGEQETQIARQGRRIYEKDHRAVLGSSTFEVFGPGSRFQIDATVADVYLISRYNPDWIIGRPILYLVVDVYSRMVVGMYVGLEGPSWMGAMMALANAASDKVAFCAQYGIKITREMWPSEHLPEILLADRGELEGYNVERLISAFNLHVENAAPYRADWKGIVEKQFDTIQKRVRPFLPGYVEKDFQERGARDYRLDAKLTLEQFTQIMIKQVLMYNTKHYLDHYVRDNEMVYDGVEPVPLNLWNWGIENRSGKLRHFPETLVRLHLLPQDMATVTHKGITFKRMLYSTDRALREGWFPQARAKGAWKIKVSYDPRNVSLIYFWDEANRAFEPCHLLDHQERYENNSLDEVQNLLAHEKVMRKSAEHTELQAEVDFIVDVENIVTEATKEASKRKTTSISKSQKTRDIKENRSRERNDRRKEEAFVVTPKADKPAEVVPFVPKQSVDDFSRPSIKDFLRKRKEQKDDE